jgi:hypothetical protein
MGRVHARALLEAVQSGGLPAERISDWEWQALHRLGCTTPQPTPNRPRIVQFLLRFGTKTTHTVAAGATFAVWLLFTGQILTSEFFKYTAWGRGWCNQPLIQLPWFNYVPAHLESAAKMSSPVAPQKISPAN